MNKLGQDITKTMEKFNLYKEKTEKKLKELCKDVKMTAPLSKDDHTVIDLLLPFFDSEACYYGDNCEHGVYEFHEVSNESNIHKMLCMLNNPKYKWVCSDDCEHSTNGTIAYWELIQIEITK